MSETVTSLTKQSVKENWVAVMDQYSLLSAESPIFSVQKKALTVRSSTVGVTMKELALMGHLILRGDVQNTEFVEMVSNVIGLALPTMPLTSASDATTRIMWTSPDEWLIVTTADRVYPMEVALRAKLKGHYSIVNQSGGQTIIELSGAHVRDVLKKSTPLDVHPREFPIGKTAMSVCAKSSALICRVDETRWQLVVRRSFANYLWCWLMDASQEYGLNID
jgi:sarcosine oxidase, subunit gamma